MVSAEIPHGVSPNLSNSERIHLYFGYGPRWMRQSGITDISAQDPDLIANSSPIVRQLLGGMGDGTHPLGKNHETTPTSQHWFIDDWEKVPLRTWAEEQAEQAKPGKAYDWGLDHGAPFALIGGSTKGTVAAGMPHTEIIERFLPKSTPGFRNFQNEDMHPSYDRRYEAVEPHIVGEEEGEIMSDKVSHLVAVMPEVPPSVASAAIREHGGSLRGAMKTLLLQASL